MTPYSSISSAFAAYKAHRLTTDEYEQIKDDILQRQALAKQEPPEPSPDADRPHWLVRVVSFLFIAGVVAWAIWWLGQ